MKLLEVRWLKMGGRMTSQADAEGAGKSHVVTTSVFKFLVAKSNTNLETIFELRNGFKEVCKKARAKER